jgi:hypothetical protein
MSTSGDGWISALVYGLTLALALQVGLRRLARHDGEEHRPGSAPARAGTGIVPPRRAGLVAAAAVWLVVAGPSLLQIPFPALLTHLERDPRLVRQGQVWRVLSGLVVQDGGIGGTIFNLAILAVVGFVAGQLWGRALPLVLLVTHLSFAVPAVFLSDGVGAGNSGATLGLAATLAGYALASPPGGARGARPATGDIARSVGILGGGLALIGLLDAHGIPIVAGVPIGFVIRMWQTHDHHDDG